MFFEMAGTSYREQDDSYDDQASLVLGSITRQIVKVTRPIEATASNRMALDLFAKSPDMVSLPVIDADTGKPIGLINKTIFMGSLAKPFYKEIYLDKSCLVFMDKNPLIVEEGTPLQELSHLIKDAGKKVVADGFMIVSDGHFVGMGFIQDVLHVLADLHRENSFRLAQHRDNLEEVVHERTQALIESRDAAEAAARAKSSFLANMSHEIRTPMNAIIGMTHLIKRDGLPPKQADRLDKIDHAARHLLAIINDILDFSRISAGKMSLVDEQIDLDAIFFSVSSIVGVLAQEKGLTIRFERCALPAVVSGDGTRLTQALLNYVNNAIKFTERGGIYVRCKVLSDNADSILVSFEVEDSGIGISPETLAGLFSVFCQADDSTTRKYGGSGLGLVITKQLAELMGGEAGAESTPGIGSRFWFSARLRRGSHPAANNQLSEGLLSHHENAPLNELEQLRTRHRQVRILLAEDEPINQEIARELLEDAGLLVEVVSNGKEAVDKIKDRAFDLALMDMQMPEMDGLVATRTIRGLPFGRALPIIAITANAFDEDRTRCLEAGMDDFMVKPLNPQILYVCLLRWLDRPANGAIS